MTTSTTPVYCKTMANYAYKLHDEKPMRDGGMTPSDTSPESLNMKAKSSSEVDAYLNPFAADNSF